MEIFNQFGINAWLLAAQAVNFLLLLVILKKFLYKPFLKTLFERREKIAKSLKDAEIIEKQLAKTEEQKEKALGDAADEAKKLIQEASKSASLIVDQAHVKASQDLESILKKGEERIVMEREKMQQELREELSDIVVAALEKVTGKVLTDQDQKGIVERTIKNLS